MPAVAGLILYAGLAGLEAIHLRHVGTDLRVSR